MELNLRRRIRLLEEILRPGLHALTQAEQDRLRELSYLKLEFSDPAFPRAEYMKLIGKITSASQHAETVKAAWAQKEEREKEAEKV